MPGSKTTTRLSLGWLQSNVFVVVVVIQNVCVWMPLVLFHFVDVILSIPAQHNERALYLSHILLLGFIQDFFSFVFFFHFHFHSFIHNLYNKKKILYYY